MIIDQLKFERGVQSIFKIYSIKFEFILSVNIKHTVAVQRI